MKICKMQNEVGKIKYRYLYLQNMNDLSVPHIPTATGAIATYFNNSI